MISLRQHLYEAKDTYTLTASDLLKIKDNPLDYKPLMVSKHISEKTAKQILDLCKNLYILQFDEQDEKYKDLDDCLGELTLKRYLTKGSKLSNIDPSSSEHPGEADILKSLGAEDEIGEEESKEELNVKIYDIVSSFIMSNNINIEKSNILVIKHEDDVTDKIYIIIDTNDDEKILNYIKE